MIVLDGFIAPSIVYGSPLLDAGVMTFPINFCILREIQSSFHRLPNTLLAYAFSRPNSLKIPDLEIFPAIVAADPDTQDIFSITHTKNNPTNILTGFFELISYACKDQVFPVAIRNAFFQSDNPLAAAFIVFIFPNWSNAIFKKVIVGYEWQIRRSFEMRIYCEEILHIIEASNRMHGFFIFNKAVRLRDWRTKPEHPTVPERMGRWRCEAFRPRKRSF